MVDLLIQGASLVRPEGRLEADLAVSDGQIVRIESALSVSARATLDARGRLLLPGLVDPHVHLRTPGATHKEDFHTGTRAAVSGGITTVLDMPNTSPPTTTRALLREKRALVSSLSVADFGFFLGATPDNVDELRRAEDDENFAAIKIFMGASTGSLLVADDAGLRTHFERTRALISVHAEDEALLRSRAAQARASAEAGSPERISHHLLRPPEVAARAVARAVRLAMETRHPLHICHVSTRAELAVLERAPSELVSLEASPHHLLLDASLEAVHAGYSKVNPPLRDPVDRVALWEALRSGRVSILGTDHAPHLRSEKELEYWQAPSGIPHLDTSLSSLLWAVQQGSLSLEQLVAIACENPARRYSIPGKGRLDVGYDADLVLLSEHEARPLTEADLYTRCGWSPFLGWRLPPKPESVWIRGVEVARHGRIVRPDFRGREVLFRPPWRR